MKKRIYEILFGLSKAKLSKADALDIAKHECSARNLYWGGNIEVIPRRGAWEVRVATNIKDAKSVYRIDWVTGSLIYVKQYSYSR